MVIFFNKRTGDIKSIFSGNIQTLDITYGNEAQDYKIIFDEIILDDDTNVLNNWRLFKVNVDTKQLELLPNIIQQYSN